MGDNEEFIIPSILDGTKRYWITSLSIQESNKLIGYICRFYSLTKTIEYCKKNNIKDDEVDSFLSLVTSQLEKEKTNDLNSDDFKKGYIQKIKNEFTKCYNIELDIECNFEIIISCFYRVKLLIDSYILYYENKDIYVTDDILILNEYLNWKIKQQSEYRKTNCDYNKRPIGYKGFNYNLPSWIVGDIKIIINHQKKEDDNETRQIDTSYIQSHYNKHHYIKCTEYTPDQIKVKSITLARKVLHSLQSSEFDRESAIKYINELKDVLTNVELK